MESKGVRLMEEALDSWKNILQQCPQEKGSAEGCILTQTRIHRIHEAENEGTRISHSCLQ